MLSFSDLHYVDLLHSLNISTYIFKLPLCNSDLMCYLRKVFMTTHDPSLSSEICVKLYLQLQL